MDVVSKGCLKIVIQHIFTSAARKITTTIPPSLLTIQPTPIDAASNKMDSSFLYMEFFVRP